MTVDLSSMTDSELLVRLERQPLPPSFSGPFELRKTKVLYSTQTLQCPPTYKCYQAHIAVGTMHDHRTDTDWFLYVAYTTFGPWNAPQTQVNIHDWSADLDDLIKQLNKTLKAKQRKGYATEIGEPIVIAREDVRAAVEKHAADAC